MSGQNSTKPSPVRTTCRRASPRRSFNQQTSTSSETFLSARGSDCGIANRQHRNQRRGIGGAFGGEKETGRRARIGQVDSWKAYMRRQTVTINWSGELPLAQESRLKLSNFRMAGTGAGGSVR